MNLPDKPQPTELQVEVSEPSTSHPRSSITASRVLGGLDNFFRGKGSKRTQEYQLEEMTAELADTLVSEENQLLSFIAAQIIEAMLSSDETAQHQEQAILRDKYGNKVVIDSERFSKLQSESRLPAVFIAAYADGVISNLMEELEVENAENKRGKLLSLGAKKLDRLVRNFIRSVDRQLVLNANIADVTNTYITDLREQKFFKKNLSGLTKWHEYQQLLEYKRFRESRKPA